MQPETVLCQRAAAKATDVACGRVLCYTPEVIFFLQARRMPEMKLPDLQYTDSYNYLVHFMLAYITHWHLYVNSLEGWICQKGYL